MIHAIQHMRRMRGGAQSHMLQCSDGNVYVVKFQNNPQHVRVLANEMLATRLAKAIGLTVPECEAIDVGEWLIENTAGLDMDLGKEGRQKCRAGLQFGSRLAGGLMPQFLADYLEEEDLQATRNIGEFAGMLALDKWTGNADGRQAIFARGSRGRRYTANFIDQGYCFHGAEWRFSDAPLRGVYARHSVYRNVTGWQSFEPWLGRIESMDPEKIWSIAKEIPPEWYGGQREALDKLVGQLVGRRDRVRELIAEFGETSLAPFPGWPGANGVAAEKARAATSMEIGTYSLKTRQAHEAGSVA